MKGVNSMKRGIALLFSLLLATAFFLAIPKSAGAQDADPPGRVARLNHIEGSVSYQASGETDWVEADRNRPLTIGDNLWADKNSRGEIHIGSTAIRMASETGISFLNLDDNTVQIQLAQGILEIRLRDYDGSSIYEVDTPNLAFTLTAPGVYWLKADPDAQRTVIIVRQGAGEVSGGGDTFNIRGGQRYVFRGGADELTYDDSPAPGPDAFEDWCRERDGREDRAVSARYVSRDVDGYYDLDEYGEWSDAPEYGAVWYPRGVAYDWAPYHYGHWVWIAPWGWTWVEDEPWGFAPFHYGRWALIGGRWGWIPGPVVARPYYAPALVAFVGSGGWGVSIGFGGVAAGVAWYPLGPRDVWVPGYRVSPRYFQTVNVTNTRIVNVTQVTNVYNNYYVKNVTVTNYTYKNEVKAVSAVRREDFVSARPVAKAAVKVSAQEIQTARVVEPKPVAPTRASYVAATAKVTPPTARPAVAPSARTVVAKTAPPPPPRGGSAPPVVKATVKPVPGQPGRPEAGRPQPNQPAARPPEPARPGQPAQPARPEAQPQPARPPEPGRPEAQPAPARPEPNRPEPNRPEAQPQPNRPQPNQPEARPQPNRPEPNRPEAQPQPNRPQPNQPEARPQPNRPEPNRPEAQPQPNRPQPNQPEARPQPNRPEPNRPEAQPQPNRPQPNQPEARPQPNRPEPNRPEAQPQPNRPQPPPERNPERPNPPPRENQPPPRQNPPERTQPPPREEQRREQPPPRQQQQQKEQQQKEKDKDKDKDKPHS